MSELLRDFELEIRKFEARFERFMDKDRELVNALKEFIDQLKLAFEELKEAKPRGGYEGTRPLELRSKVIKAFNDVLLKKAEVEHEGSHLLESFGSVLLALDRTLSSEVE